MTKEIKLTETQKHVMEWMSQGWPATIYGSEGIEINGKRVCNINTITALINAGLMEADGKWQWKATEAGRALAPE